MRALARKLRYTLEAPRNRNLLLEDPVIPCDKLTSSIFEAIQINVPGIKSLDETQPIWAMKV
jgi:hypothetical protein